MKDERAQVLTQVTESLKSARLPSAHATIPPLGAAPNVEPAQLAEQFSLELAALGVKVYSPSTSAEGIETVVGLVHRKAHENNPNYSLMDGGPGEPGSPATLEILAWDDSELPLKGLGAALQEAGIVRLDPSLPADPTGRRSRLAELGRAVVGLTGALAGLADTGTLALLSGPPRPRFASLLPPVHVAVISKAAIYPTMAAFFATHPAAVLQASNLVFITGPSRTADIEQTLTLGVHGPREVHVVLVE
jgi:L-lactate dehydrogenase complex protein LldG